jgi:hypothetical protein
MPAGELAMAAARADRGRGHADDRHVMARPLPPGQREAVVVAVQDEFRSHPAQHRLEGVGIDQFARAPRTTDIGRMVDQYDADQPIGLGLRQQLLGDGDLGRADTPRRHQRQGWNAGVHPDQRHRGHACDTKDSPPAHHRWRTTVRAHTTAQQAMSAYSSHGCPARS